MSIPAGSDTGYLQKTAVAEDAFVVTPSDTVNFSNPARALYVGTTGNITLVTMSGSTVLFTAIPAGTILPVACSRVNATATTASTIIGLL
jgi:hypothetical protein